jgi:hypothetical protein
MIVTKYGKGYSGTCMCQPADNVVLLQRYATRFRGRATGILVR